MKGNSKFTECPKVSKKKKERKSFELHIDKLLPVLFCHTLNTYLFMCNIFISGMRELKNEVKWFSMKFSKKLAQRPKQGMTDLEKRLWQLETTINFKQNPDYRSCKEKLDKRHEKKCRSLSSREAEALVFCDFWYYRKLHLSLKVSLKFVKSFSRWH